LGSMANTKGRISYKKKIDKYDSGSGGRKQTFVLGCERGGEYKEIKKLKRQNTYSRKCGCPFWLRGIFKHQKNEILTLFTDCTIIKV